MQLTNCPTLHKNAYGGWSDSEYLIYCPDCGQEIAEKEIGLTTATKEDIQDHVEGEVIHEQLLEINQNEIN